MAAYEERIVFVLAKAHQRTLGIMNRTLQPYGLTPIQYLILGALWEEEGLTAGANEEIPGGFHRGGKGIAQTAPARREGVIF